MVVLWLVSLRNRERGGGGQRRVVVAYQITEKFRAFVKEFGDALPLGHALECTSRASPLSYRATGFILDTALADGTLTCLKAPNSALIKQTVRDINWVHPVRGHGTWGSAPIQGAGVPASLRSEYPYCQCAARPPQELRHIICTTTFWTSTRHFNHSLKMQAAQGFGRTHPGWAVTVADTSRLYTPVPGQDTGSSAGHSVTRIRLQLATGKHAETPSEAMRRGPTLRQPSQGLWRS
ncbi:hypothetical protein EDB84DRAFT_1658760 [Lactarius hengduanensis]|nr:hypothetical protein EDB84DRAFT_1658760 [Lactarius hengduanensis]